MSVINRNNFRLNYFNRLVFTINIVVLFIAYSIYLNRFFTPSQIPYFNFISIGFPILFVFNLLFILYWLFVSWRHFFLTIILSLGIIYPFYLSYPLYNFNKESNDVANLSVMTFNPHGFKEDGTKELVENNLADIMLFQEAREPIQKKWSKNQLKDYYKEYFDLLTFYSKYPIINAKVIESSDESSIGIAAYADIDLGLDTIRFINLYMQPMQIKKELVKEVINSDSREEMEITGKLIENKLVNGMKMHEKQFETLIPFIQNSPYPIILGADLNSTPESYEYQTLNKYLVDSYIQKGQGNGTTFHGFKFPIRIDYLFHSKGIEVIKAKVIRKKFSDHYPLLVEYKIQKHNP
jgi:hypothetical protein